MIGAGGGGGPFATPPRPLAALAAGPLARSDLALWAAVAALAGFGLLMVHSASLGEPPHPALTGAAARQGAIAAAGAAAMLAAARFDYRLLRRLGAVHEGVRRGEWPKPAGRSARGLRMGIIGLGGIGRALARRAAAAGMETIGTDPAPESRAAAEAAGTALVPLDALLSASDVVSLHCPLTPDTHHLLNARRLAAMKPGAFVVNTGRGGLIDTPALAAALRSGRLAGAALDVFEEEPPGPSNPMLHAGNVILGSHNASNTLEASARVHRRALANLARALGREIRFA